MNKKKYYSADGTITLNYPEEWIRVEKKGPILVAFFPSFDENEDFNENINLQVKKLPDYLITMQEIDQLALDDINTSVTNLKIIRKVSTTLGGLPSTQILYFGKYQGFKLKVFQQWGKKVNKTINFTYAARRNKYDDYIEEVEDIIKSFQYED